MPAKDYYLSARKLVSQDDASIIENANIPRSKFINQWTRKTTFDAGYLVPCMQPMEVLPGDHITLELTAYVRMATPLFPMFDNQRIDTFFFFVPNRLVWTNWVKMMGEQTQPGDSIAYTVPMMNSTVGGYLENTIYDHMGLPGNGQLDPTHVITHSALPLRMYNLIYNDWFRDENVSASQTVRLTDSGDAISDFALLRRMKSHDYFTSALPWPQKFTAPTIPLTGNAQVIGIGAKNGPAGPSSENWFETSGNSVLYPYASGAGESIAGGTNFGIHMTVGGIPQVYADLATTAGIAINTLRQSWMIQSLMERDARGGTRYTELLRSHFGVRNPDARLQRPEYIGGGSTPLVLTPIAQTAPTTGVPLGALGAAGTAQGQHRASYAATEHGYIIGIINVKSELSYQQGLHRSWTRLSRYDFYWPALAQLGEQAILRQEIYATGDDTNDATVFGYQERWHEYRTMYSDVVGQFRSTTTGTLDAWHLAQNFAAAPTLNTAFLQDNPDMERVLAAGATAENQQYLADLLFTRVAVRPIPTFGTPALLGRF